MARISLDKFSAGLPITQENPPTIQGPAQKKGNVLGRAVADVPSDIVDTFKGVIGAGRDAASNFSEAFTREGLTVPQRIAGAAIAPFSGAVNAAGEIIKGGAKLFTTQQFEDNLSGAIAEGGQKLMDTNTVRKLTSFYEGLPDDQKFMLTNVLGPTANVLTAGVGGIGAKQVLSAGIDATKTAFKTTTAAAKETIKRTPQQASEAVITAANPVSSPVADTIRGAATQVKDFASRTVKEAQDTATEAKRFAEMPEAKSTLIKNGADERIVNVIESGTPEEVGIYRELVEQAKLKELDPTPNTAQPKVIAGREFLKPVQFVIDQRKVVGTELSEVRKSLSAVSDVNTNPAFRKFHEYLKEDFGVQFDKDGQIIPEVGTLATGDVPQVQKLYDQMRSSELNSEVDLDQWLQRSLKDFDLVQKREQTFSDEVTRIAGRARQEVGELMPENYNALRTEYAQLSQPLNNFVKLLGYKGKLDDLSAKDLKTGEIALRVLGNAADRPQSVIDGVLDAANANGYKSTIDLNRLIYVTDQLEDLYDITPTRGFSGSATRGINQSSAGIAGEVATLNVGGLFNRALSSRASQKEIQESFEQYLKYLDEGGEAGNFKKVETTETKTPEVNEEAVKAEVTSMIEKAPEAKQYIDDIADNVTSDIPNVTVAKAPIKSTERAFEKVVEEEAGQAINLRDLARNSLVPTTPEALIASLSKMDELIAKADADGLYTRKNVQTPEKFSGYGGVIYNIETPNGLIAEIQVVEPGMIFGKMLPEDSINILGKDLFNKLKAETGVTPGYGHELYEQLRALSIEDLEGPKGQALIAESVDYYNKLR